MATELKVPRLGMDMEEANILRWLVEEGATVEKGDPVLEIDTDKVAFEIEANADGVIQNLQGEPGETVPVGMTLAYIAAPGEKVEVQEASGNGQAPAAPEPSSAASDGSMPSAVTEAPVTPELGAVVGGDGGAVRASPAARRAAVQRGISIEDVAGSGPAGRVYLSDVLEADVRQSLAEEGPAEETPAAAATAVAPEQAPADGATVETLSRVRRVGAERTAKSFAEVPHFYLTRDLEADSLVELQARLKTKMDPAPSLTELIALAVGRTLRDHPRLNSRYVEGGKVQTNPQVNVGIAVATEEGLLVPVVKGVDRLPLRELVATTKDLVRRTRDGQASSDDLSGGTFTISNLGMLQVDSFDAIINAPQAAILAVGRTRTVPEWTGDEWVPRRVISATLSIDHRVADGADGARFLMDLQAALTDWELLL
jgi:pyruvate dehydrogenase E2 component (dihydrolipoamide acetyltransferase)